jgi:hypothetical protein
MNRGRSYSTGAAPDKFISAYHVTSEQHLASINEQGLQPKRGGGGGATDTFGGGGPTRQELTQSLQFGSPPNPNRRELAASFALESQGKVHFTTDFQSVSNYATSQMQRAVQPGNLGRMPVILETKIPLSSASNFRDDKHQSGSSFTTHQHVQSQRLNVLVGDLNGNTANRVPLNSFMERRDQLPSPTYPDVFPTSGSATNNFHQSTVRGRRNSI